MVVARFANAELVSEVSKDSAYYSNTPQWSQYLPRLKTCWKLASCCLTVESCSFLAEESRIIRSELLVQSSNVIKQIC